MTPVSAARDERMMAEAIKLGRLRKGRTGVNPAVGCVVARGDAILGRGFHEREGEAHAEIVALREAGSAARGATLYVTLEPCAAEGRTPPCAPAVARAAVRRAVIGTLDPDPRTAGKGAALLRKAGVEIDLGVRERECRHLGEYFAKFAATGIPWVTVKYAASLDGKIATRTGDAEWISGPVARRYAHRLRREHGAVAVGAGTLKADDPRLTVRLGGRDFSGGPIRLIVSSRARVPAAARVFEDVGHAPVWVACTARASSKNIGRLTRRGAEIIMCEEEDGRVSLPSMLRELAARRVTSLLVEGGEELLGSFFDGGLVDRVVVAVAPMIIGGRRAKAAVGGRGASRVAAARVLRETKRRSIDGDTLFEGYLTDVDDFFRNVESATASFARSDAKGR
jgi:diaminohydroxyphosphoribosylaminopyrimidine deaminase/5-amino-6-(5-phosphoribosylamino)uracil reductase